MKTKDKLIKYLKNNKEKWVSGEKISNELHVSRSAIWKHMSTLREMGYQIRSSPKRGYLLESVADVLSVDEIKEGLATRVFGQVPVYCFPQTDSTNVRAKFLAEENAPEGTLVVAERQTHGKGRKGRKWHSEEGGGLYFSLILRPTMPPGEAPKMTLMTAVAVAEAIIAQTGLEARIKWPNDILVDGQKIAGILTEISTDVEAINYVIVGIGLNINQPPEYFPDVLKEIATSVLIQTGRNSSRTRFLQAILEKFEWYYSMLNNDGFDPIIAQWKRLSDIVGMRVKVDVINMTHQGQVIDVDRDGVLILKDDQNRIHRILSGDVTRLRSPYDL